MLLHFVALLLICCCVEANTYVDYQKVGYILPGNIIPSHYNLRWSFTDDCSDKEDFTFNLKFSGRAQINFKAVKPGVKVIEINSLRLNLTQVTLSLGNGSDETTLQPIYYEREQKVLFTLPFELPTSKPLLLNILFKGVMNRNAYGLFVIEKRFSVGNPEKSVRKNVIGTMLEPASARTVYPCFDEPAYKASFTVSIDTSECALDKGYLAFSNSPLEKIERRKGRAVIKFEKTDVVMSTYLMTIAFAPFVSTPNQQFNSSYPDASKTEWKDMKTWGSKEFVRSKLGLLVQKAGVRLMEIFTEDFHIGYPLKKLDQLHILNFGGGMENWGVVFYGFPKNEYSSVSLVSHELAHQWFGNLVTCHWWSDLWLNEGFATYFDTYGNHKFAQEHPGAEEWNPLVRAVSDYLITSLEVDMLHNHPLTRHVEDPAKYGDVFDAITYKKGGSIIRMWYHILGEKAFLKAIRKFLDERKFDVATPKHIFQAFDSVANESSSIFGGDLPSKYFEKWTTQSGYPLVTVSSSTKGNNIRHYLLQQRVFNPGSQPPTKWTIPITYSTSYNKNFNKTHASFWLKDDDDAVVIKVSGNPDWIIVNNKFTGYYRVNYDTNNWLALFDVLVKPETHREIPVENRIQILSDLYAILRESSPSVDYDFAMNMALYLKHETDYYAWKAALSDSLRFLDVILSKSDAFYGLFQEYVRELLQDNYSRLTFTRRGEDLYNDKELRLEMVKWACRMNHSDCVSDSGIFLRGYSRRGNIYNEPYEERELYETAYCTSIRYSENDWDTLWRDYLSADFADRKTILRGISCSSDKEIIRSLLMKSVDEKESLSGSERHSILQTVLDTDPRHVGTAFDFFTSHYSVIKELYSGVLPVAQFLRQFAGMLATDEELDKMKSFVATVEEDEDIRLLPRDLQHIIDITEANNKWIQEKSDSVILWLLKRYGKNLFYM